MSLAQLPVTTWETASDQERQRILTRGGHATRHHDTGLHDSIGGIVVDVAKRGDLALLDALREHDHIDLPAERLRVSDEEFTQARAALDPAVLEAIRFCIAQVRAFNEALVAQRGSWQHETRTGLLVGEKISPIPAVGLFVPSGKGSFPSVLIQIGTPAVVARVDRIVVMVPPTPGRGGSIDPATLVTAQELGLTEVYRSNGPAGIAALACGTETVPKVPKIVGPGSPAVAAAQLLVQRYGTAIELGFGPTDAIIIADETADPRLLAADLLNEAEHGPDSSAVLVSTDRTTLERAARHAADQLQDLPEPRRGYATTSITGNGGLVLATDRQQAAGIANRYAGEHLQLAVADPRSWLSDIRYAGTILLGQWTTFAASNFAIGTPATLPTTGFAQVSSGVTAHTYLTRIAIAQLNEAEFRRIAPAITALANHEGFPAHAATVTRRLAGPSQ